MAWYLVFLDDGRHHRDPSERMKFGEFSSPDAAIAAAQSVIDDTLARLFRPDLMPDDLFSLFETFGNRPVIDPAIAGFSASGYARRRCAALCAGKHLGLPEFKPLPVS